MLRNQAFGARHLAPTRLLAATLCAFAFLGTSTFEAVAATRFVPNAAGDEVTDTFTGLIWRRCAEGQNWDGSHCAGSYSRFIWGGALAHARSEASRTSLAWRVPNVKELKSLVNSGAKKPASYPAFPDTPLDAFWTSTAYAGSAGDTWVVSFSYGFTEPFNFRDGSHAVRLVRTAP